MKKKLLVEIDIGLHSAMLAFLYTEGEMNISQLVRKSIKTYIKYSTATKPVTEPLTTPILEPTEVLAGGWTRAELDVMSDKPVLPAEPVRLRTNTVSSETVEKIAAEWGDD